MREQILRFLTAIDAALASETPAGERLDLYLIGRAALILFYDMKQGVVTQDVDVVAITSPASQLMQRAIDLFGKGSKEANTHRLYLEPVPSGLPPMPGGFRNRCQPLPPANWKVIVVHQLDIHDLAVSKLKRFAPKDRQDLRDLCDKGLLQPERLRDALQSAFVWTSEKDGDEARDGAFHNMETVIAYLEGKTRTL